MIELEAKENRFGTMAIAVAHLQCVIDMLPTLEKTPVYRHSLKRNLKGVEKEYDRIVNTIFKNAGDILEASDQSLGLAEITNQFLVRMFLLSPSLSDKQKEQFTNEIEEIFRKYEQLPTMQ